MNYPIKMQVPKVVKPKNKKMIYKTLGTSVISSPLSPPSLKIVYPSNKIYTYSNDHLDTYPKISFSYSSIQYVFFTLLLTNSKKSILAKKKNLFLKLKFSFTA